MTLTNTIKEKVTELKFHGSVMAVRQMRKSIADAYPSVLLRWSKARRDLLVAEFDKCSTVEECIEFTRRRMKKQRFVSNPGRNRNST